MRFIEFTDKGRRGLAAATAEGAYKGLLENESGYPGPLEKLIAEGMKGLEAASRTLAKGRAIETARAAAGTTTTTTTQTTSRTTTRTHADSTSRPGRR